MKSDSRDHLKSVLRACELIVRWVKFRLIASPLNLNRVPVLSPKAFKAARVIIVGPAETARQDLDGIEVDNYDIVVRLNAGMALAESNSPWLGSKTDILFHNLVETGERSAGRISLEMLKKHAVKLLVFPHWGFKGSKRRLYTKRDELMRQNLPILRVLPTRFCEVTRLRLNGHQPTIGTSAILFFLSADAAEVAIHGFTFFQTPYVPGYNDFVKDARAAENWVRASGVHSPELEKVAVREAITQARMDGKLVTLGVNVHRFLYEVTSADESDAAVSF